MIFIEISKNSSLKLQINESDQLCLDRMLKIPMVENYGFIKGSKVQPDGDLADCYVISEFILKEGLSIPIEAVNLLGVIRYEDKGQQDDKYLFCFKEEYTNKNFLNYYSYRIKCILAYLKFYKTTENKIINLILPENSDLIKNITNLEQDCPVIIKDLSKIAPDYLLV